MQLSEIIKTIRQIKGWTQRDMAAEMDTDFQDIQRMENAGRNLEKQFALFLRLLPIMEKLKLRN